MKKLLFLLIVSATSIMLGQEGFESRYFTIDQKSLPEIPRADDGSSFSLSKAPTLVKKLYSLEVTKENYWQPVDMARAVAENNNYVEYHLDLNRPKPKKSGVSLSFGAEEYGTSSEVKNTVYKESRGWYDIRPSNYSLGRYSPYSSYRPYYIQPTQ